MTKVSKRGAVLAAAFCMSALGCKGTDDSHAASDQVETRSSALSLAPFVNLTPDVPDLRINQKVDVNVLMVGFSEDFDLPIEFALDSLGVPRATGAGQVFRSQTFSFDYHVVRAPGWFEDELFGLLRSVAFPQSPIPIFLSQPPMPITPGQALYNFCNLDPAFSTDICSFDPAAKRVNQRQVTQNYLIDAVFVEKVLSQNLGPIFGIDVTKPTVVMLNWWGRSDYVDHIYLDPYEPDPETGSPRGFFLNNELAGYGGTASNDPESCGAGDCIPHRLWFYDFSAGPMLFDGADDLVGHVPRFIAAPAVPGFDNPRFHHTADYVGTPGTYRLLDDEALLFDMLALVDYTFLGNIAVPSNLYPPGLTPPRQPHHVVLDINRWNWEPGESFAGRLDVPRLIAKMDKLPYDFAARVTDQPDTHDSRLGHVWDCSLTSAAVLLGDSCYGGRNAGYADADLMTYFNDHLNQFVTGAADYEVPIFQFKHTPDLQQWYNGAAYNNFDLFSLTTPYHDQQTYVFTSTSSVSWDPRYGHGRLLAHEVGHHLGLSHPFEAYICRDDVCTFPFFSGGAGGGYFTQAARYVDGLMTYVFVNNDYSQFEIDSLRRYLTYEYVDLSNFIAGKIAASPRAGKVAGAVADADGRVGVALAAYQAWDYETAVDQARAAYSRLAAAADSINVPLLVKDWQLRRRAVGEFRQEFRDRVHQVFGDPQAEMMGTLNDLGVPITANAQLPAITFPKASVKLAR